MNTRKLLGLVLVVGLLVTGFGISQIFADNGGWIPPEGGPDETCWACDVVLVPDPEGGMGTWYALCWDPGSGLRHEYCQEYSLGQNTVGCERHTPCDYN
jgi:hypothetical protein